MKMLSRILSLLLITSLGLFYAGCKGGDNDPDPVEKVQLGKLSNTWEISSVTLDGNPRTDFTNFTLTLGGTFAASNPSGPYTYSVGGSRPSPNPWPSSGDWSFGGNPASQIVRSDNVGMDYSVTDTQLILTFTFTGAGYDGARTNEVNGNWVFTFTK